MQEFMILQRKFTSLLSLSLSLSLSFPPLPPFFCVAVPVVWEALYIEELKRYAGIYDITM
jgi:hypothetical protein